MKTVLCYGDSNTHGYNPKNGLRYTKEERWPGVLSALLGPDYEVLEEGCNGRTTIFDDPEEPWKNGRTYLKPCLSSHRPLDFLVFMLGTNDLKKVYANTPEKIAKGMELLIQEAQDFLEEKQGFRPELLLIAPPLIGEHMETSPFSDKFESEAREYSQKLGPLYKKLADRYGCLFLNAAEAAEASREDSLHMMPDQHHKLAEAVSRILKNHRNQRS